MQREEDGDYEDREGENMYAEVEDPYITDKQYKCGKCGKKKIEKHSTLFAPFCCGRPMKLAHRLEHKFDFESIAKRSIEKEQQLFPSIYKKEKHKKKTSGKVKKRKKIKSKKKLMSKIKKSKKVKHSRKKRK